LTDEFRPALVSEHEMTEATLTRARAGDEEAFRALTDPYRRELQVHCYRIVGSVQDAEDLLQETLLAAWRGLDRFEGRSSVRSWLYRIATNRSLNALRDASRRPLESMSDFPTPSRVGEPTWLQPYPDVLLDGVPDDAPGPDARYELKESVALAFVTGLQHLAPRQRAVLVLRDVLGFSAREAAEMLETTEQSINSALQRARATLDSRAAVERSRAALPDSPRERELVTRYAEAFIRDDIDAIVSILTDDALLTMPPEPLEYVGPVAIGGLLRDRHRVRGDREMRLIPTRANGQPAFGHYIEDPHAPLFRLVGFIVLTVRDSGISGLTRFRDTAIAKQFGLPRTLPR
jgi:RNA polymerase sigma-70 factor (TIGR02960 family)